MYHLDMLLMCWHNCYRHWSTFSGYFRYKCCDIVWCCVQRNVIYPLFKCVINVRLTCKWYYFNICQTCPAFWCAQYSSTHRCFTSLLICHTLLTQFCSHGNIATTGTDLQTLSLCMADLWAQMSIFGQWGTVRVKEEFRVIIHIAKFWYYMLFTCEINLSLHFSCLGRKFVYRI